VLVSHARCEKLSKAELVKRLLQDVAKSGMELLERVANSFFTKSGTLTKKHSHQGWGNACKVWDRLFVLLNDRVSTFGTARSSKNRWNQATLDKILVECFRARVIAHTIPRYARCLQGQQSDRPVDSAEKAWSLYGSKATKYADHGKFLVRHCAQAK
jgi:hypothetical protein